MTICVGALAAGGESIVCVADKALTYGGYIQWDADISKIVDLKTGGSAVMFSDEGNGPRVLAEFSGARLDSRPLGKIVWECESRYMRATQYLAEALYLKPRMLDKDLFVNAITAPQVNDLLRGLTDEIKTFDVECVLLVCGFDDGGNAFILEIDSPGIAYNRTSIGFHAIGGGSEKAISRMLFSESKRSYPVERVLLEVFDAKANAEMSVGVGYEWDAVIITRDKRHDVPKEIKDLIERVWAKANRSPFHIRENNDLEPPPRDWKDRLKRYVEGIQGNNSTKSLIAHS